MSKIRLIRTNRRDFIRLAGAGTALVALAASPLSALADAGPLKIGTIGSGRIGSTLGGMWVKTGHPVMFSSRHPDKLKGLVDGLGSLARAGTPAEAIAFADVVLLAVPYNAMPQVAKDYGKALAAKALVLDATNPIERRDGEMATKALAKGAGIAAAEMLPGVRLVRAFNAIGHAKLVDAAKRRVAMPMAGDDAQALALASKLVDELGFEPVVIGPMKMGNHLVPRMPLGGEHTADEIRQILKTLK